ncbi:MAG: glycosyltransferase family 4 protein, partial [Bacteroidota bacterium]
NFILSRRVDFVPSSNWLTRKRYNHAGIKRVLCVSDAIRKIMHDYLDINKDRCVTVYSGVDLTKFDVKPSFSIRKKYNISEGMSIIGNTSALADHKDYYTFIDTARALLDLGRKVHFFILGDGPMKEEIQEYVSNKKLKGHITFTGFVDNVPEWLKQFDVFLITSKTEGLGTSIIDALACEIPVVATKAGGIPELVIHEQTGLLAEVRDVSQLTTYVQKVLDDLSLRNELVKNGLEHVKLFSKENTARETSEIYDSIGREQLAENRWKKTDNS